MQDFRIAVVERTLTSLAHLTEVGGGDFLRRRMQKEAWPLLSHLLKQGLEPASRRQQSSYPLLQSSEAQAPAILARVRLATVKALDRSVTAPWLYESFERPLRTCLKDWSLIVKFLGWLYQPTCPIQLLAACSLYHR